MSFVSYYIRKTKNTIFKIAFLLFSTLFLSVNAQHGEPVVVSDSITAKEGHSAEKTGKFNANEMILEHISDSYDWHFWGDGEHAVSLHLPVILYSDKGLECFSSGKFEHGHVAYQGNYNYKIIHNKIKVVDADGAIIEADTKKIYDFSITKNVASLLVVVFLILILFLPFGKAYTKAGIAAPKGFRSFVEPLIVMIRDEIAIPNMGPKYAPFMPFLLTLFFFILLNNMLGLIPFFPGGANVSGNIAFTMVLSVITFIIVNVNGKKTYWAHIFKPHVPVWMYPLMIPVEIIGIFSKPFALMIRLFANMTGGHILALSLVSLIFIFKSLALAAVAVPFSVFVGMIELLVAFLQAFIFTMLASLFIGMAIAEPETEEHH
ncbi:MAG: F0F1 ATP synthase subunit A [Bacteroidota bacterium]